MFEYFRNDEILFWTVLIQTPIHIFVDFNYLKIKCHWNYQQLPLLSWTVVSFSNVIQSPISYLLTCGSFYNATF